MIESLRRRIASAARRDDGAAFVVTVAVFMFMYLMVVGVYAAGTNVKNRIMLQNACDSAAYAAAIEQADTLSRIATLNRAMSWTYVQMTRRQMDYIADRWLGHALGHYQQDRTSARLWWSSGTRCPVHSGWGISPTIGLNGTQQASPAAISSARGGFRSHLESCAGSFYSASPTVPGLAKQISDDKETVREINAAIADLAVRLPERQDRIVREIVKANLPSEIAGRSNILVERSDNPLADASDGGYLAELRNTAADESRFLWFGGYWGSGRLRAVDAGEGRIDGADGDSFFRSGAGVWFKRGSERAATPSASGIQRSYRRFANNASNRLFATWTWWATRSSCTPPHGIYSWAHVPPGRALRMCSHPASSPPCSSDDTCRAGVPSVAGMIRVTMRACVRGNVSALWNDRYVGEVCHPLVLKKEYFGKNGTVTVGLVCRNENPCSWIDDAGQGQGIFSAFKPFVKRTVCFSSAKAGYKKIGEPSAARNYKVDWKNGDWESSNQSWNLCQSDWDAVFVPVRRAESDAVDSSWGETHDFLSGYVGRLSSAALDAGAGIDWQIGIQGGRIDWDGLQERIFH